MSGEFGFKALISWSPENYWRPTDTVFFSYDEVKNAFPDKSIKIKWPIEVFEDGSVYIPSEEELQEDK